MIAAVQGLYKANAEQNPKKVAHECKNNTIEFSKACVSHMLTLSYLHQHKPMKHKYNFFNE
jgi:hypothetical protein